MPRPVPKWSYTAFVGAVGNAANKKRYVDHFEDLWSPQSGRPEMFSNEIFSDTLYILDYGQTARQHKKDDR